MENILYIAPRQSAKISTLLYEFYKSIEDTHIIHNTWYKVKQNSFHLLYLTPEQYELEVEAKYLN